MGLRLVQLRAAVGTNMVAALDDDGSARRVHAPSTYALALAAID